MSERGRRRQRKVEWKVRCFISKNHRTSARRTRCQTSKARTDDAVTAQARAATHARRSAAAEATI